LRSFCTVFERQSYSLAARTRGLSVPTVWEQVRKLERLYGAALFVRRGRQIRATPTARLLYDELRPLLTHLDSTVELVREEEGDVPRTVTIVSGARILIEDLGPSLKEFRSRFPHVRLRLMHFSDQVASKLIVSGEADLALTIDPGPGVLGHDVCLERAYRIDYLVVFPKRHPLARQSQVRLADLANYPIIAGHDGTYIRRMLEQGLYHEGLSRQAIIAAETDTSAFTVACVQAGLGVGVIAGRAGGVLCRNLAVRSLRDELGDAWVAFRWKAGRQLTATVQSLMQLIRDSAEAWEKDVSRAHRRRASAVV
jgi:DNA-binding transcriptional LysR family regulator